MTAEEQARYDHCHENYAKATVRLAAAEAHVERLREALKRYGRHWAGAGEHGCNIHRRASTDGECSCGLKAVLAAPVPKP